ncbi:MAG: FAD binding domain-containing protein [Nitrospinota bacterium]
MPIQNEAALHHIREFHSPKRVAKAVSLLSQPGAAAVAGGTDVAVDYREDLEVLVDITRLGLNKIRRRQGALHIGAAVTMHDLTSSRTIRRLADGILADAAESFISQQIRNTATLGGNLARGSPAADLPPALLALDAVAEIRGAKPEGGLEERRVPLTEFFTGPGKSVLGGGLLVGVAVPPADGRRGSFLKIGRTAEDIALVNAGVSLRLEDGRCRDVRIALGAVGPTPMRVPEAEAVLEGQAPTAGLLEDAARIVREGVEPIDDHRAGAVYRRKVSGVLARRGLEACLRNAGLQAVAGRGEG